MKTYGGVEVQFHAFLTSALDGGECSASLPGHSTSGTRWVGLKAGLDAVKRKDLFLARVGD
jgi:hypothetical protein